MDYNGVFDELIKGTMLKVNKILEDLNYCYIIEGTIISKNKDNSYQVKINNSTYTISKFDKDDTRIYSTGDIVKILVENIASVKSILGRKN